MTGVVFMKLDGHERSARYGWLMRVWRGGAAKPAVQQAAGALVEVCEKQELSSVCGGFGTAQVAETSLPGGSQTGGPQPGPLEVTVTNSHDIII